MTKTDQGRAELALWLEDQPDDLYDDDAEFKTLIDHHGLADRHDVFCQTGRLVGGPLDELVRTNNEPQNLPVLDAWDGIGRHTGRVAHHADWHRIGSLIYGTGIMAAYQDTPVSHRYILSLFYLTAQLGEAGHNCALACNAGAIRSLQALGTTDQRQRYLNKLLDPNFNNNYTASQFLTEIQGGSDVGANAVTAESDGQEGWRIRGEKWFCSNVDADVFLLTARIASQGSSTGGLGLFIVPRRLADGTINRFRIRRLKSKLGTRTMASAEIDFEGAFAETLGPTQGGFSNVVRWILSTSRLYNAFGCSAHSRRAWVVASTYAKRRTAFGRRIGEFSPVAETLAFMRADAASSLASSLWLAELLEKEDAGTATEEESHFLRLAICLNKVRTAMLAHDTVNRGIEILGGNGAIESFSVLPRLLRDNVVYENWEGTHNVLLAQVLRDAVRLGAHEGFFRVLNGRIDSEDLESDRETFLMILDLVSRGDDQMAALKFRRLAPRLATWIMLAAMAPVTQLSSIAQMTTRHLSALRIDKTYMDLVADLQR